MKTYIKLSCLAALFLAALILGIGLPAYAGDPPVFPITPMPIPTQEAARPVPNFIGHEATPNKILAPAIPQNPHMSEGAWAAHHNDTYMSDTYFTSGPLGHSPIVYSTYFPLDADNPMGLVTGITFDEDGLLVASVNRVNLDAGFGWVQLRLIDPDNLDTLALLDFPKEPVSGTDWRPAGTYFYQDQLYRIVIGTYEHNIVVVSHNDTAPFQFTQEMTYNLAGAFPAGDSFQALQPDFSGRLWFTSKGGVVGTLHMGTGTVLTMTLPAGERIANGHAADKTGGVYIASTQALYRFDADENGAPSVTWRERYDAGTHQKAGQVDIGTGTTPTLMGEEFVTITDNADPRMHVLVYRRAKDVQSQRLVCAEPVFQPGSSDTENSLVATDRSIVVENNFGYKDPNSTRNGRTTKPGITRIDMDADGNGCHTVWTNMDEHIPSVVTKMSLDNGLIYTYTKPKGPANTDAWYFTAIDFETGQTVYSQLAGTGDLYNNHYAPVYLGPDGTLYAGVLGGIVTMRDGQ
jgi:hypothetical protein